MRADDPDLGWVPDPVIAARYGVTREAVRQWRAARGIAPFQAKRLLVRAAVVAEAAEAADGCKTCAALSRETGLSWYAVKTAVEDYRLPYRVRCSIYLRLLAQHGPCTTTQLVRYKDGAVTQNAVITAAGNLRRKLRSRGLVTGGGRNQLWSLTPAGLRAVEAYDGTLPSCTATAAASGGLP